MTTYLITGATGGYGKKAIELLAQKVDKENIYALVRSEEKGADLKAQGINLRIADYNDEAALEVAFQGIDKVLFVSSMSFIEGERAKQHANVVKAAKAANVQFIAYTSLAQADTVAAAFPLGDDHRFTEQAIKESGIKHTFLRNNWYLENELAFLGAALATGEFIDTTNGAQAGWVSRDDLAEAGVNILVTDNPTEIAELSGQNRTYADIVAALNEAKGTNIVVKTGTSEELANQLIENGTPDEMANVVAGFQGAIASGFLKAETSDLEGIIGRPQTSLVNSLNNLLN
ncbi:NAD(P)H-binding protein [Streptococcus gallolyticus]|uniref:NAD(P)H-binding protein n=1 Tax=Streptococcus gallolyticus TaxID=315405 RepID=UPI002284A2A9|nr:NAD(P)H-binding protein [Streptococcus gallolyticus]MCY7187029.1 NAD(P)H-binding protein [Streptococcus gallolyticus subsp. gallolyticus]